ncbi:MAG: alpha/beta hydrolase [Gammaproteobacteria bacterium]|nr:alpha/beta hydrolase [Gammaproteobacteria bacterium]
MPTLRTPLGDIYFEQRGSRADPPVLLIHGVGCQLIHWPDSFLDGVVESGLRVIYYDNRDCGLSFDFGGTPPTIADLIAAREDPTLLSPPYTLADMAMDAVHLLNHIGQSGAHVVGVSMGGMIAQHLLGNYPERVFSLTSIMSTTGNSEVGEPKPEAIAALASNFVPMDRDAAIENGRNVNNLLGGPHYQSTEVGMGRFVELAYDRALRPEAMLRQFGAIVTDGDRRDAIRGSQVPVLAIHGTDDPLVAHDGSVDLIETVNNGTLRLIDKMGHDLSEPVIPEMVESTVAHILAADANR